VLGELKLDRPAKAMVVHGSTTGSYMYTLIIRELLIESSRKRRAHMKVDLQVLYR